MFPLPNFAAGSDRKNSCCGLLLALCTVVLVLALLSASAQAATGFAQSAQFASESGRVKGIALAPSSEDVYIAALTQGFGFGFVEEFSSLGTFQMKLESGEAEFSGVAVAPSAADVYGYDDRNEVIDAFSSSSGSPVDVFAGGTSASLAVSGGREVPVQIATDPSGDIYYPNQALGEIQEFQPNGTPGSVTITGLERPTDIAVTATRIYVIDDSTSTGRSQVQQFDSSGAPVVPEVLGAGILVEPKAVTVDSSGDVFVLDQSANGDVIDEFDATGAFIRTFAAGLASTATSLAVNSSSSDVYALENPESFGHGTVLVFSPSTVTIPSAVTGGSVVQPTVVTLDGSVNPEGTDTKYYFEYGTNTAYGNITQEGDAGSGTASVEAEAALSFLAPNQTYHYRVVATNEEGDRIYGADQEVTTEAQAPSVINERVSAITETDAEMEARINPNNEPTTYYFKYGTNPTLVGAITVPTPPGPEVGAGFEEYRVSQDIGGGLLPNTTYYFQVIAINATNTTEGPIESFTTLVKPAAETEAPTGISETTATFSGTVTTQDKPTTYTFQYVSQADFESNGFADATTVPRPEGYIEASTEPVPVTATVGGLTPDTTYHVRLLANNAGGFGEGTELTFTTVVLPPAVSTGLPVSSSPTAVTVNGGVNPEHGDTKYHFEYVDEQDFARSGYQNAISLPQPDGDAGEGSEPQIVTATFTGLAPATVYHYRLLATNVGGTHEGTDKTFATPAEGSPLAGGGSPFGVEMSIPLPGSTYPSLLRLSPTPAVKGSSVIGAPAKPLTRAQRLHEALKLCRRDKAKSKKMRVTCERRTRSKFASVKD